MTLLEHILGELEASLQRFLNWAQQQGRASRSFGGGWRKKHRVRTAMVQAV